MQSDNPIHLLVAALIGGGLTQILAIVLLKIKNKEDAQKWELAEENHGGIPEKSDTPD